jgi:superfamily II DNA or RNA helicase
MEITEDWVRGLTGWKPFKEGKALAEQGLVAGFKRSGEILQGSLREGRLNLRPIVKIAGPSDVRVQCGCPDHRATGGVCAHAVAVLLSSLHSAPPKTTSARAETPPAPERQPQAWRIHLSPRFAAELANHKLSVRLVPVDEAPAAPDLRLGAWLASRKTPAGPQALVFHGADVAGFLDQVAGHPRVAVDGRAGAFTIAADPAPPLKLSNSRLEGSRVSLQLATEEDRRELVRWGRSPAWIGGGSLHRLPASSPNESWLDRAIAFAAKGGQQMPLDEFLGDLDAWLDLFESPPPGWLGELRLSGAAPGFELDLAGSLDSVTAELRICYPGLPARLLPDSGEVVAGLPVLAPDGHLVTRATQAEDQARRRLLALGFEPLGAARFRLRGREAVLELIANGLPELQREWRVREGEGFAESASRVQVVRPEILERSLPGGSLAFELSFQTSAGKQMPGSELRRILRGGKRSLKLAGGGDLVVSRSCEEWVCPLIEELGVGRPDQPFELSGARAIVMRKMREKLSGALEQNLLGGTKELEGRDFSSVGLMARLRPYQATGAAWLIDNLTGLGGALLADEMGLGKTIQTIAAISWLNRHSRLDSGPALIVAPASLLGNWMAELERFAPDLKVLLFHGSERDRLRGRVGTVDAVVTSYGTLTRDLAFHLQARYRLVVADEASLLRNPDAEISKALCKIQADARLALSGTPVENRMRDLWSIFRFIAPGYLGTMVEFKERYEPSATSDGALPGAVMERLRIRISPFLLRRTKDQVAKDLPEKIEVDEWLDLPADQASLYSSLVRAGLDEVAKIQARQGEGAGSMHLLTLLLRLRQVCVDPGLLDIETERAVSAVKIDRLLEILGERAICAKKTLVFSQFATNLRRIEKRLESRFGRVFCIDGTTRNRQQLVDEFQREAGAAVFLISLKAGGYGLNLTAADTVIHLDPWWNPAVEAQATDRAHRIGQTQPVTVLRFLTRGTVEERVRRMQERKRAVIDAATNEVEEIPRNWTRSNLEELLR